MRRQASHFSQMITSTLRRRPSLQLILAALVFTCANTFAASPSPTAARTTSPSLMPAGAIDEKLFKGIQWRQVGPFRGGRALAIEGIPGEPDTYYFGAV